MTKAYVAPLLGRQLLNLGHLVLGSVVVDQNVDLSTTPLLGSLDELQALVLCAQVCGIELDLCVRCDLADVLLDVLGVLLLERVVVDEHVGTFERAGVRVCG